MKFWTRISLRHLLMAGVVFLFLPAILFSAIHTLNVNAQEEDFKARRRQVEGIDKDINLNIYAPFYLSPSSFDPCNPDVMGQVQYPDDWEIILRFIGRNDVACQWIYYRDYSLLAVDSWKNFDRSLVYRDYYLGNENNKMLAWDSFDSSRYDCAKERYFVEYDVTECYSEDGKLVSIDPLDTSLSPLPPMLYWFFYR